MPIGFVRPGLTETRSYNSAGQLASLTKTDTTTHTVPYPTNGRTQTWTYDWTPTGLLESVDGPLSGTGDTVTFTYTPAGYLHTRTDEVGHVTTVTSHDGRGAPLTLLDENGVQTVLTYDPLGRPLTTTLNPGSAQSQYQLQYDLAGNLKRITMPGGGWLEYTYDDASRVTDVLNDRGETQHFVLNALGEVTAETTRSPASTITMQQSRAYDELGRLMKSIGADNQTWTFEYDKVDNLKKVTDARLKPWQNDWDALDRLIMQTDPEAANVEYAYAPNDTLTEFKDGRDLATTRVIDGFGLTIRESNPDRGTRTYWYDAADRLTKMVDAKGMTTQYSYDDAGRRLTQTFTGASAENVTYSYDSVASGNKGVGRLTGVTDASGSSAFIYDAQGRLTADNKLIGGKSYPVGYGYDANGLVTTITYPSGHIVTYTRAADGKVTAVSAKPSLAGASVSLASAVAYAPFGPLKGLTYGNGLVLTRSHDQNYWLSGIALANGGTSLLNLTFGRDANGGLTGVTDAAGTGRAATFTYTDASRLKTGVGAWGDNRFSYDAAGNRTLTTIEAGSADPTERATISSRSNRLDRLRVDGGPVVADPNYAPGTSFDYTYNAGQRLTGLKRNGVDVASYLYDYAGLRVQATRVGATPSTVHYIFDTEGHLIAEHDGATGAPIREYVWLDDMPLALVSGSIASPTYHYVHTGQIDEPLIVTNAAKAKVWDAAIDPWGKAVMLAAPATTLDLRLPGQWYQAESGLHQNWMRDYDPVLGRYVQSDPLGIEAGQNLYGYVDGDPVNWIDPMGLDRTGAFFGGVLGGILGRTGGTIVGSAGGSVFGPGGTVAGGVGGGIIGGQLGRRGGTFVGSAVEDVVKACFGDEPRCQDIYRRIDRQVSLIHKGRRRKSGTC